MVTGKTVVILGGGLAGLAAAIPLIEEGFQVTVVERKPFLGGRASSYPIPSDRGQPPRGSEKTTSFANAPLAPHLPTLSAQQPPPHPTAREFIDNCQHVLLRCCTNLLDFYRRLGVEQSITFYDRYCFLDERGQLATLSSSPLPAPLHLLPSFLRFGPLAWKDRLAIAHAFLSMLRQQTQLEHLDRVTMLQWLEQHRQTARAIQAFWRPVLVSALNEELEVASARYGLKVFLNGMLNHRQAFLMGVPRVPLSQLYTEPCLRFLTRHGSTVRLRSTATRLEVASRRVCGILLNDGTRLTGDYYLSSLPPDALLKLLPEEVVDGSGGFGSLRHFETSPITAIYLWFDRQVTQLKQVALLGRKIQWIFNKASSADSSLGGEDSYVGLVVSASRKLLPLGPSAIVEMALDDLREVLPSVREAAVLGSVVIKEPSATFSCRAGCDEIRPKQKSALENFFISGDWTATGWPPTMEGAVRSGYRCAELILEREGHASSILQPDLPTARLSRWIGRF